LLYAITLLLDEIGRLLFFEDSDGFSYANAWKQRFVIIEAAFNDAVKVLRRNRANSRLRATREPSLLIQQAALDRAIFIGEWIGSR